ncbi:DUF4232 domain-containing protein [Streptomyces sp. NPDC087212]|uniref:DUF4232 domain-containing protein n=1 Tax=Streptomyces sp. NPDC087212 TaxID=3365766 RepID=UPI00382771E4
MRVHKLTIAALAVVAGLSLSACQNDGANTVKTGQASDASADSGLSPRTVETPSDNASTSDSSDSSDQSNGSDSTGTGSSGSGSSGSGSSGSGSSAGTGSKTSSASSRCRTDELEVTASDNTITGEDKRTVVVELKNGGGRTCTISGFAGVDLKTNAGTISAKREGQTTGPDTLKNGESTFFPISYPYNKTGGTGVRITGLVVTPPNDTKSVTLAWPGAGSLPATDNPSDASVLVGPIGSAGQGG